MKSKRAASRSLLDRVWDMFRGSGVSDEQAMEWARETVDNPRNWNGLWGRVHNWRNYVPEEVQKLWFDLPLETRLIIYKMANDLARREEWE